MAAGIIPLRCVRWLAVVAACAAPLAACHRPDFDETYSQHRETALRSASEMEHELQLRLDTARAAGHGAPEPIAASGDPEAPATAALRGHP